MSTPFFLFPVTHSLTVSLAVCNGLSFIFVAAADEDTQAPCGRYDDDMLANIAGYRGDGRTLE